MTSEQKTIYFSASIKGENADPELGYQVVTDLKKSGYTVLSEHVGSRTSEEMSAKLLETTGVDVAQLTEPERAAFIRKIDTEWVDEADFLVVVITGASLGVGMEIERALSKPDRGLQVTPIYCFVHEEYFSVLSAMVRGVIEEQFMLFPYGNFADISKQLDEVLPKK